MDQKQDDRTPPTNKGQGMGRHNNYGGVNVFMFVLILASSMVLGFVLMSVV